MQNKPYKIELLFFLVALAVAGIGIYYLGPSITGFVIKELSYADELNLVVTSSGNYTWHLENIGDLKSLKLDGKMTTYGKARVYIEGNGIKYLIFDSTKLTEETPNQSSLITGFAVKEDKNKSSTESDEGKKKKNKKPEWIGANEFIVNGTVSINLSQHFEYEDVLIYSASETEWLEVSISNEVLTITTISYNDFNTTIDLTASDGIDSKSHIVNLIVISGGEKIVNVTQPLNETLIINETNQTLNATNATPSINETIMNQTNETVIKTITINMAYKNGTIYDANDNGEESINGIVDLTVENTEFSWNANKSRLCTRWEIYNTEDATLTALCNGNKDCCTFIGLLPSKGNWSEVYYSVFGKDGAGHSNIVSSQVLYYDVNLSIDDPKSEIYYSNWSSLSVKFFEEEIKFADICLDTCFLSGLNKSSYTLIFEIEDNAVLRINKIKYSALVDIHNNPPVLLKNFSAVDINKDSNATINLSQYFSDPDGDALTYSYFKADNITILFDRDIATIIPDKSIEGTRFTYVTANDSESFVSSNLFMVNIRRERLQAEIKFLEIRDIADNKLAVFDSLGNLNIKGSLIQNAEPIADENDFAIQNATNGLNLVVANPEGDMQIKGTLNQNISILVPTPNSFIIQNKEGETVAYVNSTGSLFLKGILTENALSE